MRVTWLIAKATFHEAWRRRFLNAILIFAILIIGSSWSLAYLQPGAELKMLIDIGLGAIRFFGMLIAVFLGVRLVAEEIERRTIHTLLAKPVTRGQFLIGKFLGGCGTVFSNIGLMGITFYIVFAIKAPQFRNLSPEEGPRVSMDFMYANVAKAIGLSFLEMAVVIGIAVIASTILSWIMAAIFSFFLYFTGQMADFFRELGSPERGGDTFSQIVFSVLYRVLPHFEIFDMRESILKDNYVPWDLLGKVGAQAVVYILVLLLIGYLVFNRKEV